MRHVIRTTGPPIRQPLRRLPAALKETVTEEINKMLEKQVIRPSCSPWSSPVVMVRKPNGLWRFCIDFRRVNDVTHKDAYPLPRIDTTLESLGGSTLFSTLDLASGYWQVELDENSKEKTAFSTQKGHYEFNVMPFGLTNAPATFQRLMECTLAGLNNMECLIYLDDIIVFSANFTQHLEQLEHIFDRLRTTGLTLNPAKCKFAQTEVKYLGFMVTPKGIKPNSDKVDAVLNYPVPRNVTQLRHFLGMSNYYRRFIYQYSKIASPLHKLTRKSNQDFTWTPTCQDAFDQLKQLLTNPPILAYPNFKLPFIVASDASAEAIGGVLSQIQNDREVVISYWSRQLSKAEKNYSTIEKEALGAVSSIREFYPYLYGFPFTLVTDHNPLTSLKNIRDVGGRLARWTVFLQQFNFSFKYRPGVANGNTDALSRAVDCKEINTIQTIPGVINVGQAQRDDDILAGVIGALEEDKPLANTHFNKQRRKLFLRDGILYRYFHGTREQLVVPVQLRLLVLSQLHDHSGHGGVFKTTEKVKERYYWPGYEKDIEKHVQTCRPCQLRKSPNPRVIAPIGTIKAEYPFQKISWDITGPLPETEQGNRYILVVTDLFSKWVEAFPIKKTDSLTLAKVLVDEIVCRYGTPTTLHSDQGANLCSDVIEKLCELLSIRRTQTSAYHPQGNGQVERMNRTLKDMLAKMVNDNQTNWDTELQKAVFAYRISINETTGFTPFLVNFGRSPRLPIDVMLGLHTTSHRNMPQYVQSLRRSVHKSIQEIRKILAQSRNWEKGKSSSHETINIGDRVYLFVPAIKTGRSRKLTSLWRGPYTVVDKTSTVNYKICLIGGSARTMIVHRNRLVLNHQYNRTHISVDRTTEK